MRYLKRKKNISSFLIENKEILITSLIIVFCLILFIFFPINNSIEFITRNIFFLVIVPIFYYKLILKKDLSSFGLKLNRIKIGMFWSVAMLFINLLVFYLLYLYTSFDKNYILSSYVIGNFWIFMLYEFIFVNIFVFIQEFFWRGFVLLYFSQKINYLAIFLQFILYTLILILTKNSFWQMAPTLVISLTSGIITYRSKSILYSWITAMLSFLILDSFIIYHLI